MPMQPSPSAETMSPCAESRRCCTKSAYRRTAAGGSPPAAAPATLFDARKPSKQPREHAVKRRLAVGMVAVVHRQHRDRDARATTDEQGHLAVDQSRAIAPTAFEIKPPPLMGDPADPPALGGDDVVEEIHPERAMPRRHVLLDVQEEFGLSPRGDERLAPDTA